MGAYKQKMLEEMEDEDHTDEYGASMDNDNDDDFEDSCEDDMIERSIEDDDHALSLGETIEDFHLIQQSIEDDEIKTGENQ